MANRKTSAQKFADGEITVAEAMDAVRESALRMLTAAPKSRAELAGALARKGFPVEVVEPVLTRLQDVGLIDDAEYAAMLVRTRRDERGYSHRAIALELRRRGIDPDQAERALSQLVAAGQSRDAGEQAAATQLAHKLASRHAGLDPQVQLRRLVSALGRRGYPPELAYQAAREALL